MLLPLLLIGVAVVVVVVVVAVLVIVVVVFIIVVVVFSTMKCSPRYQEYGTLTKLWSVSETVTNYGRARRVMRQWIFDKTQFSFWRATVLNRKYRSGCAIYTWGKHNWRFFIIYLPVGINHLLAGFVLLLKYWYCCIYKWLNFTVFNVNNFACPAHVRTYELVAHKWKYFIAAGWRLRTIFNCAVWSISKYGH